MKRIICLALVFVLAMGMLSGCKKSITMDEILADTNMQIGSVDGVPIYAYEMIYYLKAGAPKADAQKVIVQTKIFQKLAEENGVTFTEDMQKQIDDFFAQQEEQYGNTQEIESQLLNMGVTVDQYKAMLKEALITESVVSKVFELGFVEEATDEEIKTYFYDNVLKAKHILFTTVGEDQTTPLSDEEIAEKKKLADETLAKIKDGAAFEDFMDLSEDPGAVAYPDGYLLLNTEKIANDSIVTTLANAGISTMVEPFEKGTAAIEENAVSEIVESDFGYHIIKRLPLAETDYENFRASVGSALTNANFDKYIEDKEAAAAVAWETHIIDALEVQPYQETAE